VCELFQCTKTPDPPKIRTTKNMETIKCVVVGDSDDNMKAKILASFTTDKYEFSEYVPTVFDNYHANVMISGKVYNLALFDTTTEEDYDILRPLSYPQTDIFLVCFSVLKRKTFESVESKWVPEISRHCPDSPFLLVGLDVDLRDDQDKEKVVSFRMGVEAAKNLGAVRYLECSARVPKLLKNVFEQAAFIALESSKQSIRKKCINPKLQKEEEDEKLISAVIAGTAKGKFYDYELLKMLQDKEPGFFNKYDKIKLIRNILKNNLKKSAHFLMQNHGNSFEPKSLSHLTFIDDDLQAIEAEDIVIEVMETFNVAQWANDWEKMKRILLRKRFTKAMVYLLENHAGNVKKIWFQLDELCNFPIMTSVILKQKDVAVKLWNFMAKPKNESSLKKVLTHRNSKNLSLMQICAINGQIELLRLILRTSLDLDEVLHTALVEQTTDGRTTLDLCKDETLTVLMLGKVNFQKLELDQKDMKGNTIIHHFCKLNYVEVLAKLKVSVDGDIFRKTIFETNKNGNHALMSSALVNN